MQSVELSAKTLEEARKVAALKLGVAVDSLTVTVLEETKGLFGKSTVRVRAEVIPTATPAPAPVAATPAAPATAEAKPAEVKRGRGRPPKAEAAPAAAPVAPEPVAAEPAPVEEPKARRGRGRPAKSDSAPAASGDAPATDAPAPVERVETVATKDDAEKLAGLLRELLASASMEVNVAVGDLNGRYASLKLDGKDAAYLVGKHGEVLNALQYLVNVVAHRRLGTDARATLDGNDYRLRREEVLTQMAADIAAQVRQRGEEAVLDALPAFERRIVHKALQDIEGVVTYSEGEEPNRRVVIAPAE